jgi:hypothetical protein
MSAKTVVSAKPNSKSAKNIYESLRHEKLHQGLFGNRCAG